MGKSFGALAALEAIDLAIQKGERHGLIGANGAGKTTLFGIAAGALSQSAGEVRFLGQDLAGKRPFERVRMGMRRTFQSSNIVHELSVRDNVALSAVGITPARHSLGTAALKKARSQADDLLARVQLEARAGDLARELSHGEMRQLEIACALTGTPRLLLLDEPAAGLSVAERKRLRTVLAELDAGLTMVMIEHDMEFTMSVVSRVTLLHNGRIVTQGTSEEMARDPSVRAVYLGRQHDSGKHPQN
ncbi:ABC transporter ATP-binding protein [Hypericibacter adhaerens]|uniref:ABC transporter ATP-binding protein n=1 Tax=Hypericibacter adhaerens TaxID=2602016 RepID=UPI001780B3FC|nr:ATP-binding cassette domain-containing protein [Hypericibacter adhaerens]